MTLGTGLRGGTPQEMFGPGDVRFMAGHALCFCERCVQVLARSFRCLEVVMAPEAAFRIGYSASLRIMTEVTLALLEWRMGPGMQE